jgi:eukaryotic-like serine/threonine-protein kinase
MKECQLCKNCYTDDVATCPKDGMPTMHTISGEPVLDGKYHLDCRLGQGGMGVVYKARHAYLKTLHAIKVILPDLVGNDPQLVTRFRQEALAAAAIRHQNVVSVTDYGVAQGVMPFLVMEYVEGESLHDLLDREKRLSPERALELMSAIAAGVGAAHQQGIVHRDLKPLNVMIIKGKDDLSAVKILDFGLAKIKSGELLGSFIQAQTTGLMGSPYYMAPEQWSDDEPDARSDVYSLGVMLFQMLVGDVPFKGSSIPAIMKKHLSDAPPAFSEFGVNVSPQIEAAVRHTLEKQPERRAQTVGQMIEELKTAVESTQSFKTSPYTTAQSLPVSTLQVLTLPPQASVFVDNVAVGQSRPDGWLQLEGLQSGNHHLRVKHEGFQDWEGSLFCDGNPLQVVAELQKDTGAIPKPVVLAPSKQNSSPQNIQPQNVQSQNIQSQHISAAPNASQNFSAQQQQHQSIPPQNFASTHHVSTPQNTQPNWNTSEPGVAVESQPKKRAFSPLLTAFIGISSLLLLTGIGIGAAFMLGLIGKTPDTTNINANQSANTSPTPPVVAAKAEMIKIPGGKFKMGRGDGEILERPEHETEVKDFWMDKTEVTNAEYSEFVKATNYKPPLNWEKGNPVVGEELIPVRYVNLDDVNAFIAWRSKRDGVTYRLPTEEEWEYAARNGGENNLYPWGDVWDETKAVIKRDLTFEPVGTKANGANKWGVLDLVGNVWEWTSTEATAYAGSPAEIRRQVEGKFKKDHLVVRGSFALNKEYSSATSTVRVFAPLINRDKAIGFRLARNADN